MQRPYIQQFYAPDFTHCYGCGSSNNNGLHLQSFPSADGRLTLCRITPKKEYSGGYPGNVYGGMIAMLMDCHGTASAAYFDLIHRGGSWGVDAVRRFVTAKLEINFRKPTPMGVEIRAEAHCTEVSDRKVQMRLEVFAGDVRTVEGEMVAVAL